jgi:hypothetical protein
MSCFSSDLIKLSDLTCTLQNPASDVSEAACAMQSPSCAGSSMRIMDEVGFRRWTRRNAGRSRWPDGGFQRKLRLVPAPSTVCARAPAARRCSSWGDARRLHAGKRPAGLISAIYRKPNFLDGSYWALETNLDEIAARMCDFLGRTSLPDFA